MKIKKCIAATVLLGIGLFGPVSIAIAQGAPVCPAINCDCGSLSDPTWQESCVTHETSIKKKCASNNNTPIDFCSVHGPSATPLPFALKFKNLQILPKDSIEAADLAIMESYEKAAAELKQIKVKVDNLYFKEALSLTKALGNRKEALFNAQRQVTASWISSEDDGEAVDSWRNYAEKSEELAETEVAFGAELWAQYQSADSNLKKAYRVIAFKVMRMAGESYEMAGLSYSGGEKNKKAARAWVAGAEVSKVIFAAKKESDANVSHIRFYQYQAASRLHRAGYHWALANKEKDALEVLTAAQEVSPEAGLEALIASETAKSDKDLLEILQ